MRVHSTDAASQGPFVVINAQDFDPSVHQPFNEQPTAPTVLVPADEQPTAPTVEPKRRGRPRAN